MAENILKPQIRFKGFTDSWEQHKLNDFCSYESSNITAKDVNDCGFFDLYDANELIGKTYKPAIRKDYISIIKDGAGVGRIRKLTKNTAILGTMGALKPENCDYKFLYSLLEKADLGNSFSGSTIPHIYFKDYGNNTYFIPKISEQMNIGIMLDKLDNLITLHQRKYEKLQNVKMGLLEKMFPAGEERKPQIRFKGFTDSWEQGKYSEIAELRRGLTYSPADISSEGIRVLRSSNIDEEYFKVFDDDVFVKKTAVNIGFVHYGDILITSANGSPRLVGKHAIIRDLDENSAVHGGFMLVSRTKNYDFLNASMSSNWYRKFLDVNVAGGNGAIGNLNATELSNFEFLVPIDDEQIKIGLIFNKLDTLITLHQRKCEKLINMKKALLEKMFC